MIIVVTNKEYDEDCDKYNIIVSHGYDTETGKNVPMPQHNVECMKDVKFDPEIGEYIVCD